MSKENKKVVRKYECGCFVERNNGNIIFAKTCRLHQRDYTKGLEGIY